MTPTTLLLTAFALALPTVATADPAPRASGSELTAAPAKLDRFVTFEPGRRRIYSEGRAELRMFAKMVKLTCPAATITVEGNAFYALDEEASIALGQSRADIVREQLLKAGLSPDHVTAIGVARGTLAEGNGRFVNLSIDCPR